MSEPGNGSGEKVHGLCDRCVHFRGKRRLEDLLKLPTDKPSQALHEIRGRDAEWEEEESESLLDLVHSGVDRWPARPHILSYCGLQEEQGIHLVHESKNAGERCDRFTPASQAPLRFCSDCSHRVEPRGPKDDHAEGERLVQVSGEMGSCDPQRGVDSGSDKIRQALQDRSERLDQRKTMDMLAALDSGGCMPRQPLYYETCRKYSRADGHVLCRVLNHHGHCPGHAGQAQHTAVTVRARGRDWDHGGTF